MNCLLKQNLLGMEKARLAIGRQLKMSATEMIISISVNIMEKEDNEVVKRVESGQEDIDSLSVALQFPFCILMSCLISKPWLLLLENRGNKNEYMNERFEI